MYLILLALHSIVRWLVLAALLIALWRAWTGWLQRKPFTSTDNKVRHISATIAHVQFLIGIVLYFISPITTWFLGNFSEAVHYRNFRFFGMEHSLMMLTAIFVISIGASKAKRQEEDKRKFRTWAIWYTIGLLIILSSIPWPFSPFEARPWIRWFGY